MCGATSETFPARSSRLWASGLYSVPTGARGSVTWGTRLGMGSSCLTLTTFTPGGCTTASATAGTDPSALPQAHTSPSRNASPTTTTSRLRSQVSNKTSNQQHPTNIQPTPHHPTPHHHPPPTIQHPTPTIQHTTHNTTTNTTNTQQHNTQPNNNTQHNNQLLSFHNNAPLRYGPTQYIQTLSNHNNHNNHPSNVTNNCVLGQEKHTGRSTWGRTTTLGLQRTTGRRCLR